MAKKKNSEEQINYNQLKGMWEWLCSQYEFRRDVIKGRILWRDVVNDPRLKADFEVLTDEKLNTISIEAGFSGLKSCSPSNIQMFLYSHYTEEINPVKQYLERVGKRNPVGTIKKLCSFITTNNQALFEKYLTKWLASSVANAMIKRGCQNHTCITLTGGQGAGKTTLFKWLCPTELGDYMFNGEIDLRSKDTLWKLAEYWLINLEEQIKALNRADANTMKQLITLPDVKGRRPYGRLEATGHRIANFLAGTNDDDFLTDATGSRRYLCFRVFKIDEMLYNKVKINDVWAEAYNYYLNNPNNYYVTPDDFEELRVNNEQFVNITQEQEYVSHFFKKPEPNMHYYLMTNTAIADFLRLETQNKNIRDKYLGNALRANGFEQLSYRFVGSDFPVKVYKLAVIAGKNTGHIEQYKAHPNNNYKP